VSTVAGVVTFGSTGSKTILLGIAANDVTFLPDDSTTIGYADHSFQFSRSPGLANDHSKISVYNLSGTKIAEFIVTAWGATTITCNVTFLSGFCTIPLVART
jgi:hypothetical protein